MHVDPGADVVCRRHTDRGVLDGWGLMHELLADVLEATGAYVRTETQAVAAAAGDTWTVVPLLATPHFHTNVHGELASYSINQLHFPALGLGVLQEFLYGITPSLPILCLPIPVMASYCLEQLLPREWA